MAIPSLARLLFSLPLAVYSVTAAPLERRAVIAHDAVIAFAQTVPSGTSGQLYLKYKPYLDVVNGCVPFPAVNANGDTSGGLAPSGGPSGGCSKSIGQVYTRGGTYNGVYAIMYSWYMPKDEPSDGLGHRHEWENAVVWLSSASTTATLLGAAVSQHGGYETSPSPSLTGTRPRIGYQSFWPVNHQMIFTSTQGGEQPLIAWESLPSAAKTALTDADFGAATVPFKDSTFNDNLAKAALS